MINLLIIPIVVAIIAVISTMLVGGFKSFTNLAFLVPVVVIGVISFAYGHSYDVFSGKSGYDYDKMFVGIVSGGAGMLIGSLLLHGVNLVRDPHSLALIHLRPGGRQRGCRVIRCRN